VEISRPKRGQSVRSGIDIRRQSWEVLPGRENCTHDVPGLVRIVRQAGNECLPPFFPYFSQETVEKRNKCVLKHFPAEVRRGCSAPINRNPKE